MKIKYLACYIIASFILIGCANPFKSTLKKEDKIQSTKNNIHEVEYKQTDLSSGYVYAANIALKYDTNPNKYTEIAKDLTDKSLLITGLPNAKEALDFKKIVEGKISTNSVDNAFAEKLLKEKDEKIISLEKNVVNLQKKLDNQEESFKKDAEKNAQDAQLMATIRRYFRIAIISILALFGLRIASIFVPAIAPLGMILDSFVGGAFKTVAHALPKAKEVAGVVSKEAYELSEKTLGHLVEAIEEAKKDPTVKEKLKPILLDITNKEETRPKILEIKKDLGYI